MVNSYLVIMNYYTLGNMNNAKRLWLTVWRALIHIYFINIMIIYLFRKLLVYERSTDRVILGNIFLPNYSRLQDTDNSYFYIEINAKTWMMIDDIPYNVKVLLPLWNNFNGEFENTYLSGADLIPGLRSHFVSLRLAFKCFQSPEVTRYSFM